MELMLGVVLPTLVWGSFLAFAVVALLMASVSNPLALRELLSMGLLLFWCIFGLVGLASLWLLVLFGTVQINQRRGLRMLVIAAVIFGELAAFLFLCNYYSGVDFERSPVAWPAIRDYWGPLLILLGIPMWEGVRYLPMLLRGT